MFYDSALSVVWFTFEVRRRVALQVLDSDDDEDAAPPLPPPPEVVVEMKDAICTLISQFRLDYANEVI